MRDSLPKLIFFVSALFLAFAYGVGVMQFQLFPYRTVVIALDTLVDLRENWRNDLGLAPTRHLRQVDNPATRPINPQEPMTAVTVRNAERMQPGLTFMSSIFSDQSTNIAARLIAEDGTVINQWDVFYTQLYPDRKYANPDAARIDAPATDWNVFLHGIVALPDGSIIFNFDGGQTLVRMDRCGDVMWKIDQNYHHSVDLTERDTVWSPDGNWAVEVGIDGQEIRRIDLLHMIREHNDLLGTLEVQHPDIEDRYHLNDLEELPSAIADAFPLFEAGDVVLSMRENNLILVFDPDTQEVKWWQNGPWHRQHDPDFLPDGRIGIFDNRMFHDWSRILIIDPVTREIETVYKADPPEAFYTEIRGKQQFLDNGNVLITEAERGRVFEVAPDGEIVWEFINMFDPNYAGVISKAIRYDPTYFAVSDWTVCPVPEAEQQAAIENEQAG